MPLSRITTFVNHPAFSNIIIGLILLNAVIVGLETYPALYQAYKYWFYLSELVILWVFTVEIVLRLLAVRPWYRFFSDGWNLFDFVIVMSGHLLVGAQFVVVLRILRVLRVLRAVTVVPSLQRMVGTLLGTLTALGNICLLLGLLFYVFGVTGTILFRNVAPDYFGSLQLSLLTLFQVVTLESWASGVMRPMLVDAPWSWIYFVLFILIGTFVIINLFVGVIVSNMQEQVEAERKNKANCSEAPVASGAVLEKELTGLREEIRELKALVNSLQSTDRSSSKEG